MNQRFLPAASRPRYTRRALLIAVIITVAATPPAFTAPAASATNETITFNRDIAPIIFQNCSSCHRPGEVAPFALLTYDDVRKRAQTIAQVVGDRLMPPWKADPAVGKFHDVRRLSDEQIRRVQTWANTGTPAGRAEDLPAAPKFTSEWALGEPDLIIQPSEAFHVEAEGRDVYRAFVIPTGFTQDRHVSAVDFRPGNRAVVHHVIAYLDTTGQARKLAAASSSSSYATGGGIGFAGAEWLEGWAPGKTPRHLPARHGKLIPAGADFVLQIHYHKTGKPERDQTRVGLYFAKEPIDHRVLVSRVNSRGLQIPAGESNHVARGTLPVPGNATILEIFPHMHLLGRSMTVTATLPDGRELGMVRIPDWDYNWQLGYAYEQPLQLPRGSRIDLVARFDNSAQNPRNPNHPPKLVRWGEQTTDEMCIAFLSYTTDTPPTRGGGLGASASAAAKIWQNLSPALRAELLRRFDKNGNGLLDGDERAEALRYWQTLRRDAGK